MTIGPGEHSSTSGGNPLACTVAIEALNVLEEEGLAASAEAMRQMLREELEASGSPVLRAVRGKGLLSITMIGRPEHRKGQAERQGPGRGGNARVAGVHGTPRSYSRSRRTAPSFGWCRRSASRRSKYAGAPAFSSTK